MSASKKTSTLPQNPQIVGTIHSPGSLKRALSLKEGQVDLLEIRVDHFAEDPKKLLKAAERLAFPLIVTVRRPDEGGANGLSLVRRRELYTEFLPMATFIDIELRSVDKLAEIASEARGQGVKIIVSDHHFRSTPTLAQLEKRHAAARATKADIFKLAAMANKSADLSTLLAFLTRAKAKELSVMGMGPFGKISRLLFARAGSLLNYGYLDRAQVPGQWEATLLKQRVAEVCAD
ncbi:type I 3-dehydroquinate dehydratase [Verrucomicrobiota bacterium sgz303538]